MKFDKKPQFTISLIQLIELADFPQQRAKWMIAPF